MQRFIDGGPVLRIAGCYAVDRSQQVGTVIHIERNVGTRRGNPERDVVRRAAMTPDAISMLEQKKTAMRLLRIAGLSVFECGILFIRPVDNFRVYVTTNAVKIKLSPLSK